MSVSSQSITMQSYKDSATYFYYSYPTQQRMYRAGNQGLLRDVPRAWRLQITSLHLQVACLAGSQRKFVLLVHNRVSKYLLSTLYVLGILLISNRSTLRSSYSHDFQFKTQNKTKKNQGTQSLSINSLPRAY